MNIIENKSKKYINNEEILYKYDCMTYWIFIRFFITSFVLYVIYKKYLEIGINFHLFFSFSIILLVFIFWFLIDIKTLINTGIYITNKNIYTFSGKKIALNDIYYNWAGGGAGYGSIALKIYDKNKLIISCLVTEEEEYREMISTLEKVSNNKNLNKVSTTSIKKKLIE